MDIECYIAEIRLFAGTYAPRGWAFCNGQSLPIQQNAALFSLIGTTYGGDGRTTFNLPDLRGRVAIHQGQGVGLSNYQLGDEGGVETVTPTTVKATAGETVSAASNQTHTTMQPYLCINYIIALQGIYPSRD